jgi:hypothetical protein
VVVVVVVAGSSVESEVPPGTAVQATATIKTAATADRLKRLTQPPAPA